MEEVNNENSDANLNTNSAQNNPKIWLKTASEVPLFLYFLAFAISVNIFDNLIILQTCKITYGYNETLCDLLVSAKGSNDTAYIEAVVQPYASKVIMTNQVVMGLFPAFISLFLGPWSDKNGRKPLIFAVMIGYFLYFFLNMIFVQLKNLTPWWLLLTSVPHSLLGGSSSLITGSFCYVSDITDNSSRSYRMTLLEGVLYIALLFGSIGSSYILKAIGFIGVFGLCSSIMFVAILYTFFLLAESLEVIPDGPRTSFIDPVLVSEMLRTCCKKRPNYRRLIIWLIMMSSSLAIFGLQGDAGVSYLFTRNRLSWSLESYSIYSAYNILTMIIGILIVTAIQKFYEIRDSILSCVSVLSAALKSGITALATRSLHMYLGTTVSCLRPVSGPLNRALLSKLVPKEDVGKVLSLTTSLEAIIPLMSSPLYGILYQNTLNTFPGAYNIVTASIYGLCFILLSIVDFFMSRYPVINYTPIHNT